MEENGMHLQKMERRQGFRPICRIKVLFLSILHEIRRLERDTALWSICATAYYVAANVKGWDIVFEPHLNVFFPCRRKQMRHATWT